MTEVEVHFTEHFTGESVTVSVDGREVLSAENLKTDMRTGLARVVRLILPEGLTRIVFKNAGSGNTAELEVNPPAVKWISVTIEGGEIRPDVLTVDDYAREPRGYA